MLFSYEASGCSVDYHSYDRIYSKKHIIAQNTLLCYNLNVQ